MAVGCVWGSSLGNESGQSSACVCVAAGRPGSCLTASWGRAQAAEAAGAAFLFSTVIWRQFRDEFQHVCFSL